MAAPASALINGINATNVGSVAIPSNSWAPGVPFILLVAVYNERTGSPATTVSSITSTGATWALRRRSNSSATGGLELWWASFSSAVSGYTITVNFSGAYDDCSIVVFGVTGCANPAAPFDSNVSLPAAQSAPTATWTPSFTNISTTSADDLLLFINGSVSGNTTAASGFTEIGRMGNGGGSWASIVKVDGRAVTALQSAATFTHGSALTSPFGSVTGESIFDALAGSPPIPTNAIASQALAEHWLTTDPDARITQVALEHWASVTSGSLQAVVTQVVLEHWMSVDAPVVPPVVSSNGPIITIIH